MSHGALLALVPMRQRRGSGVPRASSLREDFARTTLTVNKVPLAVVAAALGAACSARDSRNPTQQSRSAGSSLSWPRAPWPRVRNGAKF